MKNGFIEWFNRTFREDVLDAYWFEDLEQLGIIAEKGATTTTSTTHSKL
jgi:putative transposase